MIYAAIVSSWQAPDEIYHFLSAQLPGLTDDNTPSVTWDHLKYETISSLAEFHYWDMQPHLSALRGPEEIPPDLPFRRDSLEGKKPRSFVYYLLYVGLK